MPVVVGNHARDSAFTINSVSVVSDCNVCWSRNHAFAGVNETDHHYSIGGMVHGINCTNEYTNNTTVLHDCTIIV